MRADRVTSYGPYGAALGRKQTSMRSTRSPELRTRTWPSTSGDQRKNPAGQPMWRRA